MTLSLVSLRITIEALLTPAITNQENYYRQLGLRDRILNLPLMVAAVLTLLWRDVPGVTELTRLLAREEFLWCNPTSISQQAISNRFLRFPAELFERVFKDLLPNLKSSWSKRKRRPLPESVQYTLSKFDKIWIVDSSVLEALFKKLKSLEDVPKGQLGGKIGVVIDLVTRLPVEIWFQENPRTNDTKLEEDILGLVSVNTLLLLDRGFYHFSFWLQLEMGEFEIFLDHPRYKENYVYFDISHMLFYPDSWNYKEDNTELANLNQPLLEEALRNWEQKFDAEIDPDGLNGIYKYGYLPEDQW